MEINQLAEVVNIVLYVGGVQRTLVLRLNYHYESHRIPYASIKCIQLKMVIKVGKPESFSKVSRIDLSQHVHNIFLGSKADCEILSFDVDVDKQEQTTLIRSSIFSGNELSIQISEKIIHSRP